MNNTAKNIGIGLFCLSCVFPLSAQTDSFASEENASLLPAAL